MQSYPLAFIDRTDTLSVPVFYIKKNKNENKTNLPVQFILVEYELFSNGRKKSYHPNAVPNHTLSGLQVLIIRLPCPTEIKIEKKKKKKKKKKRNA